MNLSITNHCRLHLPHFVSISAILQLVIQSLKRFHHFYSRPALRTNLCYQLQLQLMG